MNILIATAMYPTPENPAFGSFVKTQVQSLRQAGVGTELLVLKGRRRKLIYPRGVFQLRKLVSRNSIDLVHAHYSYVGMVARLQRKVPVVVTYHGDDLLGTVADHAGNHTRSSKLIVFAGRMLSRLVDANIVQSDEMAGKLRARDNVHIVPHEVDCFLFCPADKLAARRTLGLDPYKKYLLFAANPAIPVKRFSLAKQVAEQIQITDNSCELVVVYKETQDRLALYMNACDALLFTSFQEGSPNIVKQAMACNLPIVSTDVGDVSNVVAGTAGCYICEPRVDPFSEAVKTILLQQARTDGRERIGHFDISVVTHQLTNIYRETIARFRSRRGRKTEISFL